jgi:hypothetical protein
MLMARRLACAAGIAGVVGNHGMTGRLVLDQDKLGIEGTVQPRQGVHHLGLDRAVLRAGEEPRAAPGQIAWRVDALFHGETLDMAFDHRGGGQR